MGVPDGQATVNEYCRFFENSMRRAGRELDLSAFIELVTRPVRYRNSAVLDTPGIVEWEITDVCNLRCEYCYADSQSWSDKLKMPRSEAFALIDQLVQCNVMQVVIEGGEPFLSEDLIPIVERLKRHKLAVAILTNGTLIGKEEARDIGRLMDRRVDYVQVSFDAAHANVHDQMDGKGSFEGALRGLRHLSSEGVLLSVSMLITSRNVQEILDTYKLVSDIKNVCSFNVSRAIAKGRASKLEPSDKTEVLQEFVRLYRHAAKTGGPSVTARIGHALELPAYRKYILSKTVKEDIRYCRAGRAKVCVDCNGDVYGCHYLMFPELWMGNVNNDSLLGVWSSDRWAVIRQGRSDAAECFACDMSRFCGKKCMGAAYGEYGTLDRKDPNCAYEWA